LQTHLSDINELTRLKNQTLTETGNVTISAKACVDSPGCFKVEVIDTGIGINEKPVEKIFLPHVRLEDATGRHTQESGLGLTIAQHLMGEPRRLVEDRKQFEAWNV
jgi:signal transduction histidine kinase